MIKNGFSVRFYWFCCYINSIFVEAFALPIGRAGGSVRSHCAPTWLAVDDAGSEGFANVPRLLCGLLLDLAKPQVHAAPSAPASSAVICRSEADLNVELAQVELRVRLHCAPPEN